MLSNEDDMKKQPNKITKKANMVLTIEDTNKYHLSSLILLAIFLK